MNFTSASKVIIQGIKEPLGMTYAPLMKAYGTQIVAGVSAGHGGESLPGIPVFDMVEQVPGPIDASVICTHPYAALDAALEAMRAGIRQIVLLSKGIPPFDMVRLMRQAEATETLLIGPNSPGLIVPGQVLLGVHPPEFYTPGPIGIISRNSAITYEVAWALTQAGLGQSIAVSIGADPMVGSTFSQWLQMLDEDDRTEAIVLVGEIGGDSEEVAAQYITESIDKPVVAYIAGYTALRNRRLGHAGAIIDFQATDFGHDLGTAESKAAALKRAGVLVADRPSQIPALIKQAMAQNASQNIAHRAAA